MKNPVEKIASNPVMSVAVMVFSALKKIRKIRAPIKIKSALPPPPKKKTQKREFYGHGFSCRKNAFFPGVHKIGAPISGPRSTADTNFTDTKRIFLKKKNLRKQKEP